MATVSFTELLVLTGNIKSLLGFRGRDHIESCLVVLVLGSESVLLEVGRALQCIDAGQDLAASINAFKADATGRGDVPHGELVRIRVRCDLERVVLDPQDPRCPATITPINVRAELDERGHGGFESMLVTDNGAISRVANGRVESPS